MDRFEKKMMKLRPRNESINYNEDSYYDCLGVFDIDCIEKKYDLIDCIFRLIDYIHSKCPDEHKSDYFMMCADLCYKFVVRFPMYKKFNQVFLKKLMEMFHNPFMNEKMKNSIHGYIDYVRKMV